MLTPIPITNFSEQEDSLIPLRSVVLKSDQFSIPVVSITYKENFLYAIPLSGGDSSYIEMVDSDGNLVANNTIPYSAIENMYSEGDQLVAIARHQSMVYVLLFNEDLGVRKSIPFVRTDVIIGPIPFSIDNKISMLWTEGLEKTEMFLYHIENDEPGPIKRLGDFKTLVYEISISPYKQNAAVVWYTTDDDLNLKMMLLENDKLSFNQEDIAQQAFGLQTFTVNQKINVVWITRNLGEKTSSVLCAEWEAEQTKPIEMNTLVHLTLPQSVFSVSCLPAGNEGFAMDILVDDLSKQKKPDYFNNPGGLGKKHFLLKYTYKTKLIKWIARFEPPEIIYHNGCVINDRLLFLHGNSRPELSIYNY